MRDDLTFSPTRVTTRDSRWSSVTHVSLLFLGLLGLSLTAQGIDAAEASVDIAGTAVSREALDHFELHVRPLLVANCFSCHSTKVRKGNLRLDSREAILAGGDSGPAVEVGEASSSLLISAVKHESLEMPPEKQLDAEQIGALEHWIASGLAWPQDDQLRWSTISDDDRSYWAFQPIRDPNPPISVQDTWSQNGIDRFIRQTLDEHQLQPAPRASRTTLIRRLYYDMLGVPPTPDELAAFIDDPAPDAYEKLVDRVLASPAYGERWGRHWLDLVRYAESDGYRQDAYRDHAWRYRDYVIRSFNDDKPYDAFIAEQLAGDEWVHADPERWIGVAYLRLPLYEYNQRDARSQRQEILNDITDVTAEVFLGFGFRCARCHDHKYDPILQADYFRLQSFFTPLIARDGVPLLDPEAMAQFQERQQAWEAATKTIRDEIEEIRRPHRERAAAGAISKFPPDLQQIAQLPTEQRTPVDMQLAYFIDRQIAFEYGNIKLKDEQATRMQQLQEELAKFDALKPVRPAVADIVGETGLDAPDTIVPGGHDDEYVSLGYPAVIESLFPPPLPTPTTQNTTGRRTELAEWMVDSANPLTARVLVNRIWQYHFGRGIVATSSDFGRLGPGPSHPELLDWLASRLRQSEWHWKPIHRLILLSSTYCQASSRPDLSACQSIDPVNRWHYRFEPRRLSGEQLRDSLMAVSGRLVDQMAGPSVKADESCKSIYCRVVRNSPHPLLSLFDGADGVNSVAQRNATTTANQALALLNDEWILSAAHGLAVQCDRVSDFRDDAWIHYAFVTLYGRQALASEVVEIREYMERADCDQNRSVVERMADVCHVLLNSNEFLYVD